MLGEFKYEFIRTPLERPLFWLRHAFGYYARLPHPSMVEIYRESARIETLLRRVLRSDWNCVDVGCHYGSMLSRFCRLAPLGRHVAFEAVPAKVRFLRRRFPDVDVRDLALSDRAGITSFYINRSRTGYSGLAPHGGGDFEQIEVSCGRLDDVLPRDRRFKFLKVDVEGGELLVFRGATEFLDRDHPLILFECGPSGPVAFGYSPADIYQLLTTEGAYSIYFLKDFLSGGGPVTLAGYEAALVYPFKAFNWVAVPHSTDVS